MKTLEILTDDEIHLMALQKSEDSSKIKQSMRVIKLGFVTSMLKEMQDNFKQQLKALKNRSYESCKHWHSGREFCTLFDIYTSIGSCGYYWESNE